VPLEEAFGRVLKDPLISHETVPDFVKSTVDGYAVKYCDAPRTLKLIGKVEMGIAPEFIVDEDTCVYVPTGGMLPEDAQTLTMVMIEDCEVGETEEGTFVTLLKAAPNRDNIIERGSDMHVGKMVLPAGTVLGVHEIGALASLGHYQVEVLKKPTVAIISTGDELVHASRPLELGQIREINTYTLAANCQNHGLKVIQKYLLTDQYELIKEKLTEAVNTADIVLISGGSSVGEKDYTQAIMDDVCDAGVLLAGMAIKPGKPTIIAKHGHTAVFGLPGHPVSSIVVFELLVRELLRAWGHKVVEPIQTEVTLSKNIYAAKGRDTYQMVNIFEEDGKRVAKPTSGKSGMITLLTQSNGYVIIPKEKGMYEAGDLVKAYYF
jgi:molybdopterin molybdotransferase